MPRAGDGSEAEPITKMAQWVGGPPGPPRGRASSLTGLSLGRSPQLTAGFARALAFQRETVMQIAEEATELSDGWLIRSPSVPLVWAANQIRLARPLGFGEAVALADRHLDVLPYRHLVVEDDV